MKKKFKDRYVLGTGYPEWINLYHGLPKGVALFSSKFEDAEFLKYPEDFKSCRSQKYRLVLERVK